MAEKRMFSLKIIDSDLFLEMPLSSQCLYYHLGMRADDDGFVDNPRKIIKIIGANDDDLKILISKGFVLIFENGVIVITHWNVNNYIRSDRRKETMYIEEKQSLVKLENGAYKKAERIGMSSVNQMTTKCLPSIDKGSIDKNSLGENGVEQKDPSFTLYGEYKNIRLTDEEYENLQIKLQEHSEIMIEKLSRYIKSKGIDYKDHYVTILNWYEQDKEKLKCKDVKNRIEKNYSTNYEDSYSL